MGPDHVICAYLSALESETVYCVDYQARTGDGEAQPLDPVRMSVRQQESTATGLPVFVLE